MADDALDELSGGLGRMWSTARLTGRLGAKAAGRILWKKKAGAESDGDADTAAAIAAAKKLAAKMGQMKGLVMKAGQIASYMPGSLPPAAQEVLAQLQAKSAPMAFARIAQVLAEEGIAFAAPDAIEETPFAAASIGQVHRATWRGRPVAVKVQYPGIADAIRSDLRLVEVIARMSALGSPVDGGALAGELRERLVEECDYLREADHQRWFARLLAEIPGASVPEVIAERTTTRVLTTALSPAAPLAALAEHGDQAARDRAGHTIFRACFTLLWRRGVFNADPHPGNFLATPAGDVTFLDFGCVRRFEAPMIAGWKRLAAAILANDRAAFRTELAEAGFVGKAKGFDWDYQLGAMRELYRPFLEPGYRFAPEHVATTFGSLVFDNPNRTKLAMPREWLFLNRLQWGLYAVLAQLRASGPWGDTIRELLAAPLEPLP